MPISRPFPGRPIGRRAFGQFAGAAALSLPGHARAAGSHLSLQAAWVNDAEFMGYFVAIDKGYYAAEGLDLEYLSGGPDVIPESSLLSGRADIALTSPDATPSAITDQGADFKIIGTQFQKNPLGVVSLSTAPIHKPSDLAGKTLAVPPVNVVSVQSLLALAGLKKGDVRIVPYEFDPTPLLKGEIDATVDFITDMPFIVASHGKQPVWFLLYDYGFTVLNDTVVVTGDTLKARRADLIKFLRASRKGWDENFKDPSFYPKAFKDSWFRGTGRGTDNDIFANRANKPLMQCPQGIFALTDEAVEKNIEGLARIGVKATKDMYDTSLLAEL